MSDNLDPLTEEFIGPLEDEIARAWVLADDLAEVLAGPTNTPGWFAERDRVMARYLEARGR
jgi:hypothetical protein